MQRNFKKKPKGEQSKKQYVAKKQRQRKEARKSNVKDDSQDYRINKLEKHVSDLNKATKGYFATSSGSVIVPTIIGQNSSTVISTFGPLVSPINLSDLASGNVQASTPAGEFYTIKHIGLNYSIDMDPESLVDDVGASMLVRVVVLVVHQQYGEPGDNGGALPPNMSDVFIMPNNANMTSSDLYAHYTRIMRNNFEILYDKIHVLSPEVNTVIDGTVQAGTAPPFTQTCKLNLRPAKRSEQVKLNTVGAGTSLTSQAQNAYYFLAFSDNPNAGNSQPATITYNYVVDYLE